MKKTIAIVLTLALCLGALAGCGSKKDSADKTITVAASPTPHAEILKVAGEVLAKDGWKRIGEIDAGDLPGRRIRQVRRCHQHHRIAGGGEARDGRKRLREAARPRRFRGRGQDVERRD